MHASLLGKPHVLRLLGARDCGLVLALFLFFWACMTYSFSIKCLSVFVRTIICVELNV